MGAGTSTPMKPTATTSSSTSTSTSPSSSSSSPVQQPTVSHWHVLVQAMQRLLCTSGGVVVSTRVQHSSSQSQNLLVSPSMWRPRLLSSAICAALFWIRCSLLPLALASLYMSSTFTGGRSPVRGVRGGVSLGSIVGFCVGGCGGNVCGVGDCVMFSVAVVCAGWDGRAGGGGGGLCVVGGSVCVVGWVG